MLTKWDNHRAALVILALFVTFVVSVDKYDITACIAYAAFPLLLITAGGLSATHILKRLLLLSPFILFMAAANPLLNRTPFTTVGPLTVSYGMVSAAVIVAKSAVSIAALTAFTMCIPFYRICEVLRRLGVPSVFVTQLALVHRYSFLLVEEAGALQKARAMRSFGKRGKGLFVTARLIGTLLLRTNDRAERIFRAMTARGFNHAPNRHTIPPPAGRELLSVSAALVLFAAIRIVF